LEALISYLERHPEEWAKVHKQVVALLKSYGITYTNLGSTLGDKFAKGLEDAVETVRTAAKLLAAVAAAELSVTLTVTPKVPIPKVPDRVPEGPQGPDKGLLVASPVLPYDAYASGDKPITLATGMWEIPNTLLALLHSGEMVVPAGPARLLRDLLSGGSGGGGWETQAAGPAVQSSKALSAGGGTAGPQGGGTIVVQVGEEKLVEIADRRLWVRANLGGGN